MLVFDSIFTPPPFFPFSFYYVCSPDCPETLCRLLSKPLRCMPRGLSLKVMLDPIRLRTTINHHTGHPSSASVSGSELGT